MKFIDVRFLIQIGCSFVKDFNKLAVWICDACVLPEYVLWRELVDALWNMINPSESMCTYLSWVLRESRFMFRKLCRSKLLYEEIDEVLESRKKCCFATGVLRLKL